MKQLLDIADVIAAGLGSRATINRLIGRGLLTTKKIGSRTKITAQSVQDYIEGLPPASIAAPTRPRSE